MQGAKPTKKDLTRFHLKPIDDIVPAADETQRLRMLIVGVNPSPWTAAVNAPFAHPGNRFWPSLKAGGVMDHLVDASAGLPESALQEFAEKRIGVTNFVPELATSRADELTKEQLADGAARMIQKVIALRPESVAISGITAYRQAFGLKKAKLGRQDVLPEGWPEDVALWVVPQPSGLNAHETVATLGEKWAAVWESTNPSSA